MGTFLGQALKSGQGERTWREFFSVASAAIAVIEKCPPVPGYEQLTPREIFGRVASEEHKLHVLDKLSGFAIAADRILKQSGKGAYHLVVLDSSARTVSIRPFSLARLDEATTAYAEIEARASAGEPWRQYWSRQALLTPFARPIQTTSWTRKRSSRRYRR
jgi:hypothetical protein